MLTIHAWLHVVDFMEKSGPLWAFWCWVMERVCSKLVRGVSSRKHPDASLDRRAFESAKLNAIIHSHDLQATIPNVTRIYASTRITSYNFKKYEDLTLRSPRRVVSLIHTEEMRIVRSRIAIHFSAQWDMTPRAAIKFIPTTGTTFTRLQIRNGDTIHTSCNRQGKTARRDATYMQYELLVDKWRHAARRTPSFGGETFFGRLKRIIVVDIASPDEHRNDNDSDSDSDDNGDDNTRPYVLLEVEPCDASLVRGYYEYSQHKATEIIDGNGARMVVGRIHIDGKWVFVRREGGIKHAEYRDLGDEFERGHVSD